MRTEELVSSGREAMAHNDWATAFDLLTQADAGGTLAPDELEDFAVSAWWTGRPDDCIDVRERAYADYTAANDTTRAGVLALELAEDHFHKGSVAMGKGWLNRAAELLADHRETREAAWLGTLPSAIKFTSKHPRPPSRVIHSPRPLKNCSNAPIPSGDSSSGSRSPAVISRS